MKKICISVLLVFVLGLSSNSQNTNEPKFSKDLLEEFELLNLCHCNEYLRLRDYDYVAFKSEKSKKEYMEEIENLVFGPYKSYRLHSQYYQPKYNSSMFIKNGFSVYFGTDLDFERLDSLYYEPLVQHYVRVVSKSEDLPYLGLGDNFFMMDCFFKIKEIPLEEELEYFLKANNKSN